MTLRARLAARAIGSGNGARTLTLASGSFLLFARQDAPASWGGSIFVIFRYGRTPLWTYVPTSQKWLARRCRGSNIFPIARVPDVAYATLSSPVDILAGPNGGWYYHRLPIMSGLRRTGGVMVARVGNNRRRKKKCNAGARRIVRQPALKIRLPSGPARAWLSASSNALLSLAVGGAIKKTVRLFARHK